MRYLITGGAGFIGSHLADRGDTVTVLDDLSTGLMQNVATGAGPAAGARQFVRGCVTDAELVGALMDDCDVCVHLASAVGVQLVVSEPLNTLRRIVAGSEVVISSAAERGKRVLFASTSEVYGKSTGALSEDSDRVLGSALKSRWSYAIGKSYGESLASAYHRERGADTVIFRLFNTIGPRQRGHYGMVVPRFVRQALCGEDITVYGDGSQSRCFMHVADAVEAIVGLADTAEAAGGAFNIGNPEPISILGLAQRVIERTGSRSGIRFIPYAEAYDDGFEELGRRQPDLGALQSLLGWSPQFSVDQALDAVITFQRAALSADPAPLALAA
jgi:UDP-glucose 4-epimerase